jgi:hypothetical protein
MKKNPDYSEAVRRVALRENKEREKLIEQELKTISLEREAKTLEGQSSDGVPKGLKQCPKCGQWRGRCQNRFKHVVEVSCICTGVLCKDCGERYHRPISNYYDEYDKGIWHVPYFGAAAHEYACRGRKR